VVERVDRTVSFGGRQLLLAAHGNLDRGLGQAGIIQRPRGHHAEALQRKGLHKLADCLLHQDRQRPVGRVELIPLVLHQLDLAHHLAQRVFLVQIDAQGFGLVGNVAFAGHVGDQNAPAVADQLRRHVFVSRRIFRHGADMDASLVRKSAPPHERPRHQGRNVGHIADIQGKIRELPDRSHRQAAHFHFDLQIGNHGDQIGVSGPLAVAVDRSLNDSDAFAHRRKRIGNGQAAVVVGVNAGLLHWNNGGCFAQDGAHFMRHGPAVRVAENDPVRARVESGPDHLEGIPGVVFVAVKKMLRVKKHLFAPGLHAGDGIADHGQIFFQRHFQNIGNVKIPGLAEDRNGRGFGPNQRLEVGAMIGPDARLSGRAECGQFRIFKLHRFGHFKKAHVLGVGTGPAAFNVMKMDVIQTPGDPQLFFGGKGDLLPLRAVAERCIVNQNPVLRHGFLSFP